MKIIHSICLILALSLMGAHSCTKTQNAANKALVKNELCKNDDDCVTIKADCCGCRNGGTQKAISKAMLEQETKIQNNRCQGTMCIQAISTDQSCAQNPVCRSGVCQLE